MKILTAEEMGAADRRSVEAGVSVWTLMQDAGRRWRGFACGDLVGRGWWWCWPAREIMVAMGWSRRRGWRRRAAVRVALLGKAGELKGEAAQAPGKVGSEGPAGGTGHEVVEMLEIEDEAGLRAALDGAGLVIDAVVGTGFKPPLRGLAAVAQGLLAE